MKKYWVIIVLLVILIVFQYFYYNKPQQPIPDPIESTEKIDSLESEIDSLYKVESNAYCKIDTVYKQLDNNTKEYEKTFNTIINNDTNEDLSFFLEYIRSNKARLDSTRNLAGH